MKRIALSTLMAATLQASAQAGPNAGGTLILHANTNIVYSSDATSYCGQSNLTSCSNAVTALPLVETATVFFLIAAFANGSNPRLAGIAFGVQYDTQNFTIVNYGKCADFELAAAGWPASGSGTALTWNTEQTSSAIEVYWFAGYAYDNPLSSGTIDLIPHPTQGATFADNSMPPTLDPIGALGYLGIGSPGYAPCVEELQSGSGSGPLPGQTYAGTIGGFLP